MGTRGIAEMPCLEVFSVLSGCAISLLIARIVLKFPRDIYQHQIETSAVLGIISREGKHHQWLALLLNLDTGRVEGEGSGW